MNNFNFILNADHHYALSQPEWLWLIPIFLILNLIVCFFADKHFTKSAGLAKGYAKQFLFHPLINLLSRNEKKEQAKPAFNLHYFIVFSLLILALSQPIKIGEKIPEPPQERDITFIVDTSVSMILRDYILDGKRIDRMSLLKVMLDTFIQQLNGERMSIIVFGDRAFTLVPLTSDQYLLRRMLSRVQATMAGRFNAIGDAIALAVKQTTQSSNSNKSRSRKRILVLLTDADQPTGEIDPVAAAKLAKNIQLPLYTIAIGATTSAAAEQSLGGLLYSPVDLKLIKNLSFITGATSYQAGNPNALKDAIQSIKQHETNKRKLSPYYYHEPLYYWVLLLAFIILSLKQLTSLFLLNYRKKTVK